MYFHFMPFLAQTKNNFNINILNHIIYHLNCLNFCQTQLKRCYATFYVRYHLTWSCCIIGVRGRRKKRKYMLLPITNDLYIELFQSIYRYRDKLDRSIDLEQIRYRVVTRSISILSYLISIELFRYHGNNSLDGLK